MNKLAPFGHTVMSLDADISDHAVASIVHNVLETKQHASA